MELWLRLKKAVSLQWDVKVNISSQLEWQNIISQFKPISSILWPIAPLFKFESKPGSSCFKRRHRHEKNYENDPRRNASYLMASKRLAYRLGDNIRDRRALVYAPMRGAYPIWRSVRQFIPQLYIDYYFPVTSSFVFYPQGYRIMNRKGRLASGRFTNILELQRLKPLLKRYRYLVYIDEIVSGGMMAAYLKEMIQLDINKEISIIAAGIADVNGAKSALKREVIKSYVNSGRIFKFLWEGCDSLITQDQKFLLGVHYMDYNQGLNIIPFLDKNLQFYQEKKEFDKYIFKEGGENAW